MAQDIDDRIGRNLRGIRVAAGLSIDMLASRTGLQAAVLTRYEDGRSRIPVDVLALLSTALGRPVRDFFV